MHWFFRVTLWILLIGSVWSTFAYALPKILPVEKISNSEVYGLIVRRQVWEGTIRVKGDLVTLPGVTITIKPGTNILVAVKDDKFNFDFLPWHRKSGVNVGIWKHGVSNGEPFWDEKEKIQIHIAGIDAIGTKEQPITITSDSERPSPYDFNLLKIDHGVLSNARVSDYRRLEIGDNVVLSRNIFSQVGECAVCISSGSPTIAENVFEDALRESIWVERASPKISDNLFVNLSGEGIRINSNRVSSPLIIYNTFEMPDKVVLDILSGGEKDPGVISFNKFSGNTKINIACDSKIMFSQNEMLSVISFIAQGCGGSYIFGPNYWGVQDKSLVFSERITNKDKRFELLIPSILSSPPKGAGRRVRN